MLAAVVFAVVGSATLASGASAQIPSPTPTTAVVRVFVGGDRDSPTTIAPLPGVTYGLFAAQPTGYDPFDGYTNAAGAVQTCTSDADGDCVFVVPITGSSPVRPGDRLWVAPISGPAGSGVQWFENPVWQTAPLVGSPTDQTRHVFQTPALFANQAYISGSNGFISQPGSQTTPPNPVSEYTRRIDSGGVWPLSRRDPDLPAQCGLNVALVVDLSSSMNGSVSSLKNAMDAFVNSLRGTPSRAALFTFSTNTPAVNAGPNTQLNSVSTTGGADAFKALYSGWTNATANGYTNWDTALNAVASINATSSSDDRFNLVVFMTDGNPTVYSPITGAIPNRSGYTRFREIGNAVASANRLKATGGTISGPNLTGGTRVLAVGVGAGLNAGSDLNLRSISGRTAYDPSIPIADVDYYRVNDYTVVAQRLRDLFLSACAPSVSVIKQVIPSGGTIADAFTPTEPWTFSGTPVSSGLTVSPASGTTSPTTGALAFDLDFDEESSPATVRIDETVKPGHSLFQVGGDNAVCVDKSEDDQSVPVSNQGPSGFQVSLGLLSAVSCVVYNQAPDPSVNSLEVGKRWRLTTARGTEVFANGSQPSDLQASMTLTGPGAAGPTFQPWGVPREGYAAQSTSSFDEDVTVGLPGCRLTGASIERVGQLGFSPLDLGDPSFELEIQPGTNRYLVTNDVECHSNLRLLKQVEGGPADPLSWGLQAIGPPSALTGPEGTSGVTTEVTDSVTYQLAERADPADPSLLNYRQFDNRQRPLAHPLSTGSMTCDVDSGGGNSMGGDGGVSVPRGQDVTCVSLNQTASINVIKQVNGGKAGPADFEFTVAPVDPDPPGVPTQTLRGAASPGNEINVRPGQRYRITETSKPGRYRLTSLSCSVNGDPVPSDDIVLAAGTGAVCRAVNTYRKPNNPTHARVTVVKKANRSRARHGQRISYRIVVRSVGDAPARNVRVCDLLPRALILVKAPRAKVSGGRACWTLTRIDPGARRVLRVVMRVPRVGVTRRVGNTVKVNGGNVPPRRDVENVVLRRDPPPPPFTG